MRSSSRLNFTPLHTVRHITHPPPPQLSCILNQKMMRTGCRVFSDSASSSSLQCFVLKTTEHGVGLLRELFSLAQVLPGLGAAAQIKTILRSSLQVS